MNKIKSYNLSMGNPNFLFLIYIWGFISLILLAIDHFGIMELKEMTFILPFQIIMIFLIIICIVLDIIRAICCIFNFLRNKYYGMSIV